MSNILAIVGRPNVGKSTFFNRLTMSRDAIVDETSGVTRDRHYGKATWNDIEFSVIDTGGYIEGSGDAFEKEIQKQIALAVDEADAIIFMVDVKEGVTSMDKDVAKLLRKTKKKVFLVANKVDNALRINDANEFYQLGIDNVFCISSINGSGTGELLDEVVKLMHKQDTANELSLPKFAVVGRPNVGKSSLINALIGNDRNIVTAIPGTTRDSVHTHYKGFGFEFLLIDTAGIRKKSKVHENVEFYSVMRSIRAIEESDVCLLLIDASLGFEAQDMSILSLIQNNRKGVVIIVNKWDLVEKSSNTHKEYEEAIRAKIAPFKDIPILFTSVINKQRIHKALELSHEVYENCKRRVTTSQLNDILLPIIEQTPPPAASRARYIKIKYITQLPTAFPAFAFFCNLPQDVKESYVRFLENKIRENFNFSGVPIEIYFRKK